MKLGIAINTLGLPIRRALAEASRLGVPGVQVDAVGELAPDQLSQTGRREFRNVLRSYGLEVAAVGCPLRYALNEPTHQDARIEHVRKVMSLSFDLGARLVVAPHGQIPAEFDSLPGQRMTEALLALGQHGDRIGARLALETGLEPGQRLREFLERLDTGGLAVNYDPANLLINGYDPLAELTHLIRLTAHVHAHDARANRANRAAQEVPLGAGDIDWMTLTATLEAGEYRGYLTLEREQGNDRLADIAAGLGVLRRIVR